MSGRFTTVPRLTHITAEQFHTEYLAPEMPVLISGLCSWKALGEWSPEYFRQVAPELQIRVKEYRTSNIQQTTWTVSAYADFLREAEQNPPAPDSVLPYCHDIPIFAMLPDLVADVEPFPAGFLSEYYRAGWWRYVQFFLGPAHSLTPLHFDTLLTHNLFFQIYGSKRFTLYAPEDARYCYRRGWRWFDVDPERPDYERFPEFRRATPIEVVVHPGDILYMPPGTLHHVRGLSTSISFNIDFHTRTSALRSLKGPLRGMPAESFYYNVLATLGVHGAAPAEWVFRRYKPYLSYVV